MRLFFQFCNFHSSCIKTQIQQHRVSITFQAKVCASTIFASCWWKIFQFFFGFQPFQNKVILEIVFFLLNLVWYALLFLMLNIANARIALNPIFVLLIKFCSTKNFLNCKWNMSYNYAITNCNSGRLKYYTNH